MTSQAKFATKPPIPHRDHDIAFNPHVIMHTLTLALDMALVMQQYRHYDNLSTQ